MLSHSATDPWVIAACLRGGMTYALGRGLEFYDMPVVRGIVRDAGKNDYKVSSLIMGIVKSTPFQMRKTQDHESN